MRDGRLLWEQRDVENSLRLYDFDGDYCIVSANSSDGIKFEVSPVALLDLAFTIYEELG